VVGAEVKMTSYIATSLPNSPQIAACSTGGCDNAIARTDRDLGCTVHSISSAHTPAHARTELRRHIVTPRALDDVPAIATAGTTGVARQPNRHA
jgi:hypothetical protein